MPYLSPDADPTRRLVCRRLTFYEEYAPAMAGAISSLLAKANWEQVGDIPVDQILQELHDTWLAYREIPCMVGGILPFATEDLPDGILPCDGSVYNREDFPDLYAYLDPVYIIDSDSFSTPDLRGRMVIGTGTGSLLTPRSTGDTGGEEEHTLTISEMPSHHHIVNDPGIVNVEPGIGATPNTDPGLDIQASSDTGGGNAHENMPPFHALVFGIIAR